MSCGYDGGQTGYWSHLIGTYAQATPSATEGLCSCEDLHFVPDWNRCHTATNQCGDFRPGMQTIAPTEDPSIFFNIYYGYGPSVECSLDPDNPAACWKDLRDADGTLKLPILSIERVSVSKEL